MHRELTTEQFQAAVEQALQNRLSGPKRNLPGMGLAPHFVRCDGPSLQLEVAYETKTWMSNPMGVLHGGMTAVLLDTSMGIVCCSLCGHGTPTISMTVNYTRPVPLDRTVHVRVRIVVFGRTSSQLTAALFLPKEPDRILAFATGVYSTKADADYTQHS